MSTVERPCPNADLGPRDVEVGQVWHHYLAQGTQQGYYRIAYMSGGVDLDLELVEGYPHGASAEPVKRNMDVGHLLAHWEYKAGMP